MISNYCIVFQNKITKTKFLHRVTTNNLTKLLVDLNTNNDVLDVLTDDGDDEAYIYLFEHYSIKFENVIRDYVRY